MKNLLLLTLSTFLLTACGGDAANEEGDNYPAIDSFSILPYTDAARDLSSDGLEGTWVGVIDVKKKRYDMINAEVNELTAYSVLTAFIIRERENEYEVEGDYEIANCTDGFEALLVNEQTVLSKTFYAINDIRNGMGHSVSGSRFVALSEYSGYTEDYTFKLSYRRVSDSTVPLGEMTFNWSDVDGQSRSEVYCSAIENHPDDGRRVVFSSDDESIVQLADFISPPSFDAYVSHSEHEENIVNYLTLGEQSFSFIEETTSSIQLEYSATSSDGLTSTGQASIQIIP